MIKKLKQSYFKIIIYIILIALAFVVLLPVILWFAVPLWGNQKY